ncbi:hypothetical protein MES4922_130003 [Mesorhizobium ventifaucium]|uniref:Uncharacterized protein n=1 Tax=Mesorhizobium ventifaucium TaxID=666020 RepID=A0ABN8JBT5_9HYPH|nr:hypothetical protein MES4922_130003 [Mesorhizobium ventifaucium]
MDACRQAPPCPPRRPSPTQVTGHFLRLLPPPCRPFHPSRLGRLVSVAVARLAAGRHYLLGCVGEAGLSSLHEISRLVRGSPEIRVLLVGRLDRYPTLLTMKRRSSIVKI